MNDKAASAHFSIPDDDDAIDAQVDVDDAIKTLLEATRSQATVNAALVTQLMNINTTQAALQVQIAAIAAPPPGPVDPKKHKRLSTS